jgi:outer membrane murein-binding lipoprotein Lpp
MARGTIRRIRYLLMSAIILASLVLAGAANWPKT